jgi:hypothetical protein
LEVNCISDGIKDIFARYSFTSKSTGDQVACLDVLVQPPVTVQQAGVSWATGAISIVAVILAALGGLLGFKSVRDWVETPEPYKLTEPIFESSGGGTVLEQLASAADPVSLLLHFQFISNTGLLSISYPSIYQAFTLNFAWANFIFPIGSFLTAASQMGAITGGCKPSVLPGSFSNLDIPEVSSEPGTFDTGMSYVADFYGTTTSTIGGIVYLSILLAVATACVFFGLIGLILLGYSATASRETERHEKSVRLRGRWSGISSNYSLKLVRFFLLPADALD